MCCFTRGHYFLRIFFILQQQQHTSITRASSIMDKTSGSRRPDDRDCSFGHFCITPKQEQGDWSLPVNSHHGRETQTEIQWAITSVAKIEDPRSIEDQYLLKDMNSFPELLDLNKPHHMEEFEDGEVQIVESSWERNPVFSPAPLSTRAPLQNPCQNPLPLHRPLVTARGGPPIAAFTVQCSKCLKWRMVPTKEQYEAIRHRILEEPWSCENAYSWRPGASCGDPTDFSQDSGALWAIDRPNIPRPPPGWERKLVIRSEGSTKFGDIYYHSPCGKKLRSMVEVDKFLKEHPEYVNYGVNLDQFSYTTPQPLKKGYVRPKTKFREANGHSETSNFVLHQTLVKQLKGPNSPIKAMRGSLKRVSGKSIAPNHIPPPSQGAATAVYPLADRFVSSSNVLRGGTASPCDIRIMNGDGGPELLCNGQTASICGNDSLQAHIEVGDARASRPNITLSQGFLGHLEESDEACANEQCDRPYQEGQVCSTHMDAANFREEQIYPFASCSNPIYELPQFLKKKRRTIRLSSISDQDSNLINWK